MRKKYLLLLLIALAMALGGCPCDKKKPVAPPPAPDAPFDLTATVISCEQIDLVWKYIAEKKEGFNLYRKTTGSYSKIAVTETTSYSDSPLSPETTYWYKVTAYGEGGESQPSSEVTATTPPEVEMLDYHMNEYFYDWSQEWNTRITGNVKNNTSRILTVKVRGKFFNYDNTVVSTEGVYLRDIEPGNRHGFYMYYYGERVKRVEAWIENYYTGST